MVQRLVVAASCLIFYILTVFPRFENGGKTALLVLLAGLACCEKLGSIMNLVSVEKDWVYLFDPIIPQVLAIATLMMRLGGCCIQTG